MAALTRPCGEFLHRLAGGGHAPAQEKQSIFGSIRSKYALAVRAVARLPRWQVPREQRATSVNTGFPDSGRPIFKPRETRTADGVFWYVEVEWADSAIEEIGRFSSVSEAWDWISRQSREWLDKRTRAAR